MTIEEKRAITTLILFTIVTVACVVLLVIGPDRCCLSERQLYLLCLSMTAVAHIVWIAQYGWLRHRRKSGETIQDERDQTVRDKAASLARCMCCLTFFICCMALAVMESYLGDGLIEASTLFGLVLLCSIVTMLSLSISSVVLYRRN